jgi:hypothetical protein
LLPWVRLLADSMECAWAKDGKVAFTHEPFPVEVLWSHVWCGAVSGPLWLCDAFLVVLGLCTMGCASELCALWMCDLNVIKNSHTGPCQ